MSNFYRSTEDQTLIFGRVPAKLIVQFYQFLVVAVLFINLWNGGTWVDGFAALIQLVLLFGFVYEIRQIMGSQIVFSFLACVIFVIMFGNSVFDYFANSPKVELQVIYLVKLFIAILVQVAIIGLTFVSIEDVDHNNNGCAPDTECCV